MAFATVNGVALSYERAGRGPTIVYTPGGWFARGPRAYWISGRLSSSHTVLLWDRRNSNGSSDIAIGDHISDWHAWAQDLHGLLAELEAGPAYLVGNASGSVLSLLMAHLYPADVRGLVLMSPLSDDILAQISIPDGHYLYLAEAALSGGMEEVLQAARRPGAPPTARWVLTTAAANRENRARFLAIDPDGFARFMRRSCFWFMGLEERSDIRRLSQLGTHELLSVNPLRLHRAHLSNHDLAEITVPILTVPGPDPPDGILPERTAHDLWRLLPNTRLCERPPVPIGVPGPSSEMANIIDCVTTFFGDVESGRYAPDDR